MYHGYLLSHTLLLAVYHASQDFFDAYAEKQKERVFTRRKKKFTIWMKLQLDIFIDKVLDEYRRQELSPQAVVTVQILRGNNILQYLLGTQAPPEDSKKIRDTSTIKRGSFATFLKKRGYPYRVVKIINTFTRIKSKLKKLPRAINDYRHLPTIPQGTRRFKNLHKGCGVCDFYRGYRFATSYGQYLVLAACHSGQVKSQLLDAIPALNVQYVQSKRKIKPQKEEKQQTTEEEEDVDFSWSDDVDLVYPLP